MKCYITGVNYITNISLIEEKLKNYIKEAECSHCNEFIILLDNNRSSLYYGDWIAKHKNLSSQLTVIIPYLNFYNDHRYFTEYQRIFQQCDKVICYQTQFLDSERIDSNYYHCYTVVWTADWHILIHNKENSLINNQLKLLSRMKNVYVREIII